MKLFLIVALVASFAFSANIVSFTAESIESQKDANNLALEGLAKQLKSRVESETKVTREERKTESGWQAEKTMESSKKVSTNIVLKGAKVVPGKKNGKNFTATASVDVDQMASKLMVDLETVQKNVKSKDSVIRFDMLDRDYRKMTLDMLALEKLVASYDDLLENMSYVKEVPSELRLDHTLNELTEFLLANLSSLKIETEWQGENLVVTISDFAGPVVAFPIALVQDSRDLLNGKTDKQGKIVFEKRQIAKNHGAGDIVVRPDLSFRYVRTADVVSKTVHYESAKTAGSYKLECSASIAECGALKKTLSDGGIALSDGGVAVQAYLEFADKKSSAGLFTTKLTLSLKKDSEEIVELSQGVGKDIEAAHVKAIQKLPFARIKEKLE